MTGMVTKIAFSSRSARRVQLTLLLAATTLIAGCSRAFWRNQGDMDAYDAISQKNSDYRWNLPRFGIVPDPRSRFYEPYDPDCIPLPPDDPAAHLYMHWMDGWEGYKGWHDLGQSFSVENPQWVSSLQLDELQGEVEPGGSPSGLPQIRKLTLKDAIDLSLIHSRDYQTQIENVYLSALNLTGERFRFSVQYNREPFANTTFSSVPDGQNDLAIGAGMGISQLLPSGAQWLVELTNNTLWVFSNGQSTSTASNLSYQIVQPLFRNAGRRFVMNGLTQAERNLLYSIRDLARFRKIFFVDAVSGNGGYINLLSQLQRNRNLEFNIRLLKEQIDIQRSTSVEYPGYVEAALPEMPDEVMIPDHLKLVYIYLADRGRLRWRGKLSEENYTLIKGLSDDPLYQRAVESIYAQMTRKTELNIANLPEGIEVPASLSDKLLLDRDKSVLIWTGPLSDADVGTLDSFAANNPSIQPTINLLFERLAPSTRNQTMAQLTSQLATQENGLRQSWQGYRDALDRYKLFLGLPTDLEIDLDDSMLDPFMLIDQRLLDLDQSLKRFGREEMPKIDETSTDLTLTRGVLLQLKDQIRLIEVTARELLTQDLARVREVIEANKNGPANVPEGIRVIETEVGPEYAVAVYGESGALTESGQDQEPQVLNRLQADLDADTESLNEYTQGLTVLKAEIDLLVQLSEKETLEEMLESLDANSNGQTEVDELPVAWSGAFRRRSDDSGDGIISPLEFKAAIVDRIILIREEVQRVNSNMVVLQVGLRAEVVPIRLLRLDDGDRLPTMDECVQRALESRLDLMNERARVMDARRAIEVAANRLETVLDVVVDGDIGTSANKPLDFRGEQSVFRAGFRFTAPMTLVTQRNAYNASIVNYWRAKRSYMLAEDTVKQAVRASYRELFTLRQNIEVDRLRIRVAAVQYDSSVEGARGANSALDLLRALETLLGAQNSLINDWVAYERARLNIFLDMGIMEIDPRGLWFDDYYQKLAPTNQPASSQPDMFPAPAAEKVPAGTPLQTAFGSLDLRQPGPAEPKTLESKQTGPSGVSSGNQAVDNRQGPQTVIRRDQKPRDASTSAGSSPERNPADADSRDGSSKSVQRPVKAGSSTQVSGASATSSTQVQSAESNAGPQLDIKLNSAALNSEESDEQQEESNVGNPGSDGGGRQSGRGDGSESAN